MKRSGIIATLLLLFIGSINAQVFNPYLKLDWRDSTDYTLHYGELKFDEDFDMEIQLEKSSPEFNDTKANAFLEDFKRVFQELPKDKQNVFFYCHGFGAHNKRYLRLNNTAIQKEILNREDADVGIYISLSWYVGFNYLGGIPKCVQLGNYYGGLMEEVIRFAKKINPDTRINLMTHSMGNRVFIGMQQYLQKAFDQPMIDVHIMAAPDIEPNVFDKGQPLDNVFAVDKSITIYRHNTDRVLTVSSELDHSQRLGLVGINEEQLDANPQINLVDCSLLNDVEKFDMGNHNYYYLSPTVRNDIYHILFDKKKELSQTREILKHPRRLVLQFPN